MSVSVIIDDNLAVVPSRVVAVQLCEPYVVVQGGSAGWRIAVLTNGKWATLKDFGDDQFAADSTYKVLVEAL